MRPRRLRDLAAPTATAVAMWAWANRDEVVDWAAFGVRAAQQLARGDRADARVELRLRGALLEDRRTRRAAGLSVQVRDGTAILSGLVSSEVREVALHCARRTEGVATIDDRLDVLGSLPARG